MASIATWFRTFGFDAKRTLSSLRGIRRYLRERREFHADLRNDFAQGKSMPMLDEWNAASGALGAYFFQDQLVARWIHDAKPVRHVDVGSRLDGFVGNLSVFREVEVIDLRPCPAPIRNVIFHQLDLMEALPDSWVASVDSLSCLHTIEHFGLGRYGDSVSAYGHLEGLRQLQRMVAPGGMFYLSTPIGPQRVEFNAHRVFSARTLIDWFGEGWVIEKFAVIDDENRVREDVDWTGPDVEHHFGCHLGVGIVAARKTR